MDKFSPLADILRGGRFVDTNYMVWMKKLNLILIAREVDWILKTPTPLMPGNYTVGQKEYDR